MPGTKNMLFGSLWAIGGTVVTVMTYAAASGGGTYVVAYGAIGVGGIQFVVGLLQFLTYHAKGAEGKQRVHAEASLRAVLRAMMATAIADGVVEDREIDRIATIYEQLFGASLEKSWIKENADTLLKDKHDIYEAISDERAIIEPSLMPLVLKAAYFVAAADGYIDEKELTVLMRIAEALGMDNAQVQGCFAEIEQAASA